MNLVKQNLSIFLPELTKFIGDEQFPWDEIDYKFDKKIESRFSKNPEGSIIVEACIFDQIVSIKKRNTDYTGMMDFYNKLFYQLNTLLNKTEKKLILKTIRNLLVSFDSKYLNYLGELSALYKLKQTNNFILLDVEKVLPNGKSIDFDMMIKEPKMQVLIEILNIQINPEKVEDDSNKICDFINGRIIEKLSVKKLNLVEEWNIHLVPIIWGGHKELEIYNKYFKNNSLDLPLTYEPLAFITYYDNYNNYFPKFGAISSLFN